MENSLVVMTTIVTRCDAVVAQKYHKLKYLSEKSWHIIKRAFVPSSKSVGKCKSRSLNIKYLCFNVRPLGRKLLPCCVFVRKS
jgi:hypothetical protein